MSRQFASIVRFFLLFVGVTAVLTLTVHAAPATQDPDTSRPRFNLEEIPYQAADPGDEELLESALAVTIPSLPWSKVVFQSIRKGNWDIYLANDDASGQTAVVSGTNAEIHPHLNRGNTKIVYAVNNGGDFEIYVINVDGTGKTALTSNTSNDGYPSWSPDGSKIVFEAYRNGEADIYVMNANGTNQTRLTTSTSFDGMPTWSPDGSKIAFVSRRTGGYRIYVMNADGSGQTQISTQPYSLRPQWSPDGSKIAFDADNDGDGWQDLWVMNADGTGQYIIRNPSGQTDAWASGWSPDANYITYTSVSFIQYEGNWYWTQAHLYGTSLNGSDRIVGSTDNTDWDASWQTNDNIFPTSYIKAMSAQSAGPIVVQWPGSDAGGSGMKHYDVQVKIGSAAWTNWLVGTTNTFGLYPGVGGQTYAFRVRATDNSYNREAWPASADTATRVESLPPVSFLKDLPEYSRSDGNLDVSWSGTDPGNSGIQTFDVQYQINDGSWVNWHTGVVSETAVFAGGSSGSQYDFRVRAIDNAQNQGVWSTGENIGQTTFYSWGIEGNAYDNTGAPVSDVSLTGSPTLLGQAASNINGFFGGYLETVAENYGISWQKSGYTNLPITTFSNGSNAETAVVMPPANNLIADWGFESGGWSSGWQQGGTQAAAVTADAHTGSFGALLGQPLAFAQGTVPNIPDSFGYHFDTDVTNTGHLIFFDIPSEGFSYQQLHPDGSWSTAEFVAFPANFTINQRPEAVFEPNGRIHLFWLTSAGPPNYTMTINHIQRNLNGQWTAPEQVIVSGSVYVPLYPAVDSSGNIHLLYPKREPVTYDNELFYISRINNSWRSPLKISVNEYFEISADVESYETSMKIGSDGTVYAVWVENVSGLNILFYKERHPVNGWQPTIRLVPEFTNPDHTFYHMKLLSDGSDNLYLFWENTDTAGGMYLLEKSAAAGWLAPVRLNNPGYQYIIRPEYAVSANGELFVAYFSVLNGEQKMILRTRDSQGIWQAPRELRQETEDAAQSYIMGQIDLDVDAGGTLHIVWSEIIDPDSVNTNTMEYQIIYVRKRSVGKPEAMEVWSGLGEANSYYLPPTIYAHTSGQPTMLWLANSNAPLHFATPQAATSSGTYTISTEVTIPGNSVNPVLSFLYDLAGAVEAQGEGFTVTVDNGSQVTTLLATSDAASWQHVWYDMSAWVGQTVTLSFTFTEAANTAVSHAAIDEVTLGTSYPDVWITNDHTNGAVGEHVTHTIAYGNQGGAVAENSTITFTIPTGLAYRAASVAPTAVSSQEISWQVGNLSAKGNSQTIEIELEILSNAPRFFAILGQVEILTTSSELETLNNTAVGTTFVGRDLFLPLILTP
jgi:TolB protein